jgi:hypothetical protein
MKKAYGDKYKIFKQDFAIGDEKSVIPTKKKSQSFQ